MVWACARPAITLRTLEGALQLNGNGQLGDRGLKFNGDARAAPGFEPSLNNLLNIIGRRNGAFVTDRSHSPADFACTIYSLLGINPHKRYPTPSGQEVAIVGGGTAIAAIMGT